MKIAELLKSSGLAALAAAMAVTALPQQVLARDNDRQGWSQRSGNGGSARSSRPANEARSSRSESRSSRSESRPARSESRPARSESSNASPPPARAANTAPSPQQSAPRASQAPRQVSVESTRTGRPGGENRTATRQVSRNERDRNAQAPRGYDKREMERQGAQRVASSRSGDSGRSSGDRDRSSGERNRSASDRNRSYSDGNRNRSYGDGDRNRSYSGRDRDRSYGDRNGSNRGNYRDRDRDHRRWDNRWRNNHRYDWRDYRTRNRTVFHLGIYYAPYRNYYYSRVGVGFYLDSLFFASRYWIADPWQYRLPEVYGPYRWVRYYDDVLLVDIYTGEVVDVIHDFFW
jgi:hypothetical protein